MNAQTRTFVAASSLAGAIALALACGSSIGANAPVAPVAGKGQLRVDLVDAPNPVVDEIWVNITRVTAHSTSAGWFTIASFDTPLAVDLLKLHDAAAPLGLVTLSPGTITQIRLVLAKDGNHVVIGGQSVPLKVPSGFESGVKIHGPWQITACERASVTLDFDGKKSIWYHPTGHADEWILRPVIRTRASGSEPVDCAASDAGTPDAGSGEGSVDPVPGGIGSVCGEGLPCLVGACGNDGTCVPGGSTDPCGANSDCASGACGTDDTCTAPSDVGGVGATCTENRNCLSNACSEGLCEAGAQGAVCHAAGDCQAPLRCLEGACAE